MKPLYAFLLFCLCIGACHASVRGVSKRDLELYSGSTFKCRDGSAEIGIDLVNDDYCDCQDGSDEPGTSACSNGSFFCANKGFQSLTIPSSRVNDGVCDCCDGSDEWGSGVKCADDCKQQGLEAHKETLQQIKIIEEGSSVRSELVSAAKKQRNDNRAEIAKIEEQLKQAEEQVQKAKALKAEQERLEEEARKRFEEEKKINESITRAEAQAKGVPLPPDLQDAPEDPAATEAAPEASVEAGEFSNEANQKEDNHQHFPYPAEYAPKTEQSEENFPYPAEYAPKPQQQPAEQTEEVEEEEEEEEMVQVEVTQPTQPPVAASSGEGWFSRQLTKFTEWMGWNADALSRASTDLEGAERELTSLRMSLAKLQDKDGLDFGENDEFLHMHGQCYSTQVKQYTYELCPFDTARQKEGHSDTSLGRWKGWEIDSATGSRSMKFENGAKCWNGPERSLQVFLHCSTRNEITSVDEPSKCVYHINFGSPAVCHAEHATILRLNMEGDGDGDLQ